MCSTQGKNVPEGYFRVVTTQENRVWHKQPIMGNWLSKLGHIHAVACYADI